jgi:hypothetical protein
MLQDYYTVIIPIVFALISTFVKLLSRRDGDTSPKRNDTCIGQAMMLGALSASLVFAINAQRAVGDLHEKIDNKAPLVKEAQARILGGAPTVADLAYVDQANEEFRHAALRAKVVDDCLVMASLCILLVMAFAFIDRYYAFETVINGRQKSYCRKWKWWYAVNIVGMLGFVTVLLFTKQGK